MDTDEDQDLRVKKDLAHLTRTLTSDNINTDEIFAKKRGIRSCTPPFDTTDATAKSVSERLKRIKKPPE